MYVRILNTLAVKVSQTIVKDNVCLKFVYSMAPDFGQLVSPPL